MGSCSEDEGLRHPAPAGRTCETSVAPGVASEGAGRAPNGAGRCVGRHSKRTSTHFRSLWRGVAWCRSGEVPLRELIRNDGRPLRSIPIDVLRAFVAVVEERGFTRAAETLGRTQPTISLQVKRLEELVEAPLFERSARLELTRVGEACFDYGKRLLRLHDDMLDEVSRRKSPGAPLRIGAPGGLAGALAQHIASLAEDAEGAGFEIVTDGSAELAARFREKALDAALVVADDAGASARWRAPLAWFGNAGAGRREALPLLAPPPDCAVHHAAVSALRARERKFDVVFVSSDFTALAGAAAAGLGVAPLIEGVSPCGARRSADRTLPPLPPATLSLLSHSARLAEAGRRWVELSLPKIEPI